MLGYRILLVDSQSYLHTNVIGSFTSLGESTNPSFLTMNPSKVQAQYPMPFESIWNSGDESFRATDDAQSHKLNIEDPRVNFDGT
nr:hypothetical protein [Tanacetum cinerariifolium]